MDVNGTEVAGLKFLKAIVWVVYAIAVFASIIIAFTFFLLLFNASPKSGFVQFVYSWGIVFAQPFKGMIPATKLDTGGVLSWSALFAIAAYSVLAWFIGLILNSISRGIYRKSRPAAAAANAAAVAAAVPPATAAAPAAPAAAPAPEPAAPAAPDAGK